MPLSTCQRTLQTFSHDSPGSLEFAFRPIAVIFSPRHFGDTPNPQLVHAELKFAAIGRSTVWP
jgi:hypothetical protein